jgi:hypothetical protein
MLLVSFFAMSEIFSTNIFHETGAFGARNIPAVMKAIELLGIEQGRQWEAATLNEVRLFFKLKPHATFRKPFHFK